MGRRRKIRLEFYVSEKELRMIQQKIAQIGTDNLSAYLRKIAINGCIVKLELPELRDMVALLRRSSNNLNQIARRVNETGCFYAADMEDILAKQEKLWQAANEIIARLASIG